MTDLVTNTDVRTSAGGHPASARQSELPTLAHGDVVDHRSREVADFVTDALDGDFDLSRRDLAVRLYYAVRDGIFYEVYATDLSEVGLRASAVVRAGQGFCLHKSVLFAAATRAVGIPSRIVGAPVRNHLSSVNLQKLVGGEVFLHWFNEVWLDGAWVKATPVFNKLLCKLYGLEPLEFDGTNDSLYHADTGNRSMEFVGDSRRFENPHYSELIELVRQMHPGMVTESGVVPGENRLIDEPPVRSAERSDRDGLCCV